MQSLKSMRIVIKIHVWMKSLSTVLPTQLVVVQEHPTAGTHDIPPILTFKR